MIGILLSTYNGERYIDEQLSSILNQEITEKFKIIIRDDGSSDKTKMIIKKWVKKAPRKISIVDPRSENIGTANSFDFILKNFDADYYLWCDQDDVWHKSKLNLTINRMRELEKKHSKKCPLLVIHDMNIINEDGVQMEKSFLSFTKLTKIEVSNGIFQGFIPGCSMCINDASKKEYFKVSRNLILHDFHSQIIIYLTGVIDVINEQLMSYRVHSTNQIGIGKKNSPLIAAKDFSKYIFNRDKYQNIILNEYSKIYFELIKSHSYETLRSKEFYSINEIKKLGIFERKKWFWKHFKPFNKGVVAGLVRLLLI